MKEKKILKKEQIEKQNVTAEENSTYSEAEKKAAKRKKFWKYFWIIVGHFIYTGIFILIGMIWQKGSGRREILQWANSFTLATIMVFFVGWIMFIYNKNILSLFVHSVKTFGLMIVGKRPAKSYYEVKTEIEDNPIPKIYMRITFLFSLVIFVATVSLVIIADITRTLMVG